MAFRVGSGQSIDPDSVNTWRRFTSDGIPYMFGSYKNGELVDGYNGGGQMFRGGGDDIASSFSGTHTDGLWQTGAFRSYVPYFSDGTHTTADALNTTDFGNTSSVYTNRGNNFVAAQGKLFIGAPSLYDDQTTTNSRGGVFILHPNRIRTTSSVQAYEMPNDSGTWGTTKKGKLWDLVTADAVLGVGHHYFGQSLDFADGKLFPSAYYYNFGNTNGGGAVLQISGNYNSGSPDLSLFARPNRNVGQSGGGLVNGPEVYEQDSRWGATVAAGCGKIAVSDNKGRLYIRGISYYNGYTPPDSDVETGGWKEIVAPNGLADEASSSSWYGRNVQIGCGRIIVGAGAYNSVNQGRLYIYDLDGNLIRILTDPDPSINGYFGYNAKIGSGRIVVTQVNSARMYIFDLDGDLVSKHEIHPGSNATSSYYTYSNGIAVGFGRIFTSVPGALVNLKSRAGLIYCWDLDGNAIGRALTDIGPSSDGYSWADLGAGGLAVAPGRLYGMAPNYSGTNSSGYPNLVHEWCIHTSLTPYDVQAMEDGDL